MWLWGSHLPREADLIEAAHATIWRRLRRVVWGLVPRSATTASTMLGRPARSLELAGPHSPQGLPMKSIGGAIVTMPPALPAASDMFGTTMLPALPAACDMFGTTMSLALPAASDPETAAMDGSPSCASSNVSVCPFCFFFSGAEMWTATTSGRHAARASIYVKLRTCRGECRSQI